MVLIRLKTTKNLIGLLVIALTISGCDLFGRKKDKLTVGIKEDQPITATSKNQAPTVDAGSDKDTMSFPLQLIGKVTDDGLPTPPGQVTVKWTKVSGPSLVIFDYASSLTTNVSFGNVGTYVIRLSADDGEFLVSDEMTVTVLNDTVP